MYRSSIAVVVPVTFTVGVSARTVPSGMNRDAGVPITVPVMRHFSCCCCCNQKQAVIGIHCPALSIDCGTHIQLLMFAPVGAETYEPIDTSQTARTAVANVLSLAAVPFCFRSIRDCQCSTIVAITAVLTVMSAPLHGFC